MLIRWHRLGILLIIFLLTERSENSIFPDCSLPFEVKQPLFLVMKVAVVFASTDSPNSLPVSEQIPEDAPSSPLGYSIGRWEGETLIVETAQIDFPYLDDAGTPMSADVEMAERFTLSENGTRLDYEVTVTDPLNLAEPAVEDAAWRWVPGTEISPYECIPE